MRSQLITGLYLTREKMTNITKRKFLIFQILIFFLMISKGSLHAQSNHVWNVGAELDVLPYLTGGYFACVWAGKNKWRGRVLTAYVKKPDWSTTKGFRDHEITAYALVADRFLKDNWKGWWIGGGPVFWKSRINSDEADSKAEFNNILINGSLGYNFSLSKHLYISPWAALSLKIAGDKDVVVNTRIYNLPLVNPEMSLKLGYYF
jgi:hypothetical protein